jgi:alpha-galactosidase
MSVMKEGLISLPTSQSEKRPTITIIGAGSAVFTQVITGDLLSYPELNNSHIVLEDIDKDRLNVANQMVGRMIEQSGAPAKVTATIDQKKAIRDSDVVITMLQVGGLKGTLYDFDIPERYGLHQTIGDSYGVGGISRAVRTIPIIQSVINDMQGYAPEATLLNYTNPQGFLVWSMFDAGFDKAVGLCHSVSGTAEQIAQYMDMPYKDLEYNCAGINHLALYHPLIDRQTGKDLYPKLMKAMENPEIYQLDPVRFDLMKRSAKVTPRFVTESSEHSVEYYPGLLISNPNHLQKYGREYVRRSIAQDERWQKTAESLREEIFTFNPNRSKEYAPQIIYATQTDNEHTVYINTRNVTPNGKLITDLPEDAIVEVKARVDKSGVHPFQYGELQPMEPYNVMNEHIKVQRQTVFAVLHGKSREDLYQAILLDPRVQAEMNEDDAISMADDLLDAHTAEAYGNTIPAHLQKKPFLIYTGDKKESSSYALAS